MLLLPLFSMFAPQDLVVGAVMLFGLAGMAIILAKSAPTSFMDSGTPQQPSASSPDTSQTNDAQLYDYHLKQGGMLLGQLQYDAALEHYQKACALKPDVAGVWWTLGSIYQRLGEPANAFAAFEQVLALNPRATDAHYELARLYKKQQQYAQAENHFRQALEQRPNHLSALQQLVRLLYQQQRQKDALPFLEQLLNQPDLTAGDRQEWEDLKLDWQFQSALSDDASGAGTSEQHLIEQLTQLTRQPDARRYKAMVQLAQLYQRRQDPEQALILYQQVLNEDADGSELRRLAQTWPNLLDAMSTTFLTIAEQSRAKGQAQQSIALLLQAIAFHPENPRLFLAVGQAYQQQQQKSKALAYFEEVVRLDPANADGLMAVGALLEEQGQGKQALACMQRAVEVAPERAEAHFRLGVAYGRQGLSEPALFHLSKAVQMEASDTRYLYNLAVALESSGQEGEAKRLYAHVLMLDPTHREARGNLERLEHLMRLNG